MEIGKEGSCIAGEIYLSTDEPLLPDGDFSFYIDFKKGEGSASRVFAATQAFIEACERLDAALIRSIHSDIETIVVLEDIEAASLKTVLRNILNIADDTALKSGNWKKVIGNYLVQAKYAMLRWTNTETKLLTGPDLATLGMKIKQIAAETEALHIPSYTPPTPHTLITGIKDFEHVKDHLAAEDRAAMILPSGEQADFNLGIRHNIENLEALAVRETAIHRADAMVLIVKKPDYLGESMWEVRHGTQSRFARIEDREWLKQFQSRGVDVRPGDALRCHVRVETEYGYDNEVITERITVEKVEAVLENEFIQYPLLPKE